MVRISNLVLVSLNICTLILGFTMMSSSLFLYEHGETECQETLQEPLRWLGSFMFFVSTLGFIGSCCRVNFVLVFYMFEVIIIILDLMLFTFFVLAVTNQKVAEKASGFRFREIQIRDLSGWLRKELAGPGNWNAIASCMADANVCSNIPLGVDMTTQDVYKTKLSYIQKGCCMPREHCGFENKNGTWIMPERNPKASRSDCQTWNNEHNKLCYYCNSCRVGFLTTLRKDWKIWTIINGCALCFVVVVLIMACCVRRNNKEDKKNNVHRYRNCYP